MLAGLQGFFNIEFRVKGSGLWIFRLGSGFKIYGLGFGFLG